jgi:hypothetical protein
MQAHRLARVASSSSRQGIHGPLVAILVGLPAGLRLDRDASTTTCVAAREWADPKAFERDE